ncbi:MAG: hypothetical protein AAGI28_17245 [Pseudomonadota bacterium]
MNTILNFRVLGLPVVATSVGSFLVLATMFMWYGGFFVERFHPLMGIVEEQVTTEALGIWYHIGIAFTTMQGIGMAKLLQWRGWPGVLGAAETGATAALMLGCPVFGYRLVILPEHSVELFFINTSGLMTAWTLAAVSISALMPKRASDATTAKIHQNLAAS